MANMKQNADEVSNMLNSLGFIPEKFCVEVAKDHRTIQQNFTRLCFVWIKLCASDEYRHDERNRASHIKCKAIVDTMSADPAWDFLPYI